MMQYIKVFVAAFLCLYVCACSTRKIASAENSKRTTHYEMVMQEIRKPSGKYILVAAHRGDWRNAPENSIQALQNCIDIGVDIMEFDIRSTKDGQLIVMHDDTLDRNTTGKGKISDYTLAEIKQLKLKDGLGQPTSHSIPTFEEMMLAAKGKIVVDIDKGYKYFDDVVRTIEKLGMYNQCIVNVIGQVSYENFLSEHPGVSDSLVLMPVVGLNKPRAHDVAYSYNKKRPLICQFTFDSDTSTLLQQIPLFRKENGGIWYNSLWPNLSASHNDDKAVEENKPDETWGWLIQKGASIIQTDRPYQLLKYLEAKGLRPKF